MLDVTDLTVRYGPFLALDGISLNVERGEIVGLIGPNGAGKSTLVRTIAGLVPPAAGAIRFKEQPLAGTQPFQRVAAGLSLVPEGRGLFPYMSVEENLLMGAYSLHDTRRARMVMERWLNLFPILRERKRQLAGTLSGGQQQMLAVAMGLMCEPDLCMLDEPSLGLAPIVISDIVSALRELKRSGVTVLLAEQNAKLASDVADRIYVLQTGRVRYHDIPENLLRNPEVAEAFLSVY